MDQPTIAIITGLSGAGRTSAAKVLEDLGYFVIDNMPPQLLTSVVSLFQQASIMKIALVVDVRGQQFFHELDDTIAELDASGASTTLLYLEAHDDVLVRRYEAGRRIHPLAGQDRIVDGITRERELLAGLRATADLVIDTSGLSVHDLRDRLHTVFQDTDSPEMVTNILSFGFKHGIPQDVDMLFDVRFLPNPHWVPELRPLTGLDAPVRDYVLSQEKAQAFLTRLFALLDLVVPAFHSEGKRYLTIGIGCTGGNHRSVALAEAVAQYLRDQGESVTTRHRDRMVR
ncbi:RNase adapter RapZ [Stomatohabitans albus]|uniref:RNase adapter RapZ n=1 Tax=Stomatohabitans albus TaxID=3110766 RepID=UPI00300C92CA